MIIDLGVGGDGNCCIFDGRVSGRGEGGKGVIGKIGFVGMNMM
jgi:hypothetical protein